jgi:hypothetical protein
MKKIDVTIGVYIEALGPDETQDPIIYIIFDDYPDRQSIPVYAREIKSLVNALAEAAGWIAENWTGGGNG